jgi:hypothetical protein
VTGRRDHSPHSGRGEDGRYDREQRVEAARVQRSHPAWVVLYGPYSRTFYGFPAFAVPAGTIVTAATPADLVVLMRQAEIAATTGPGYPSPRG